MIEYPKTLPTDNKTTWFMLDSEQLCQLFINERRSDCQTGLYRATQLSFAFNSNCIEGISISHTQVEQLFDAQPVASVSDANAIANHFVAFDYIINNFIIPLSIDLIKELHRILMRRTLDAQEPQFVLGNWRTVARSFGGGYGTPVNRIDANMSELLNWYSDKPLNFQQIAEFHARFERIHPFHNGNGRVGRLLLFKELMRCNCTPLVVPADNCEPYFHGLEMFHAGIESLEGALRLYQRQYEDLMIDKVDLSLL